jgi:hypothetical protein
MKLPSIVGTISFKLSALYLLLFLCSFLSIGITVYLLTYHTLEQQLKNSIETEAVRLKTEYDSGGLGACRTFQFQRALSGKIATYSTQNPS